MAGKEGLSKYIVPSLETGGAVALSVDLVRTLITLTSASISPIIALQVIVEGAGAALLARDAYNRFRKPQQKT